MKLVTLNIWGGKAGKENLLNFFEQNKNVDIFCLQEIWSNHYKDFNGILAGGVAINHDHVMIHGKQNISNVLENHNNFFRPHLLDDYGLFSLVKKDINVLEEGEVFVHKEKGYIPEGDLGHHARNIQYIKFKVNNKLLTVINFHGLWNGKGKNDGEDRIKQSKNVIKFFETLKQENSEMIFCGDFNLNPDTISIKIFEDFGLKNLIKDFKINSTRTSLYTKEGKFADYVFTSENIHVKSFEVMKEEVSDHAALCLDFDLN